jgi:peptide/nickel transport system permease protein
VQTYLLRRVLASIPTLIGVTVLIFVAMRVIPGDPISLITSEGGMNYALSEDEIETVRRSLGLDRPYHEQYVSWIGDVLKGELGRSFWRQEPIRDQILRRAPITAQIALMAIACSWIIGLPVGMLSALKRNQWPDYVSRVFVIFFVAVPAFWVALLIVLAGVLIFNWRASLTIIYFWEDPRRNLEITLGPAIVLGLGVAALTARMARSATLEVLHEDYVRTARAKGLGEAAVVTRHALKNAAIPIVTIIGLDIGTVLGGAVITETVFAWPGVGRLAIDSIAVRDFPVVQADVFIIAVAFVGINFVVDVVYTWLDPRIRFA